MMAITGVCPFDPSVPGVRVRKGEEGVRKGRGGGEEGVKRGRGEGDEGVKRGRGRGEEGVRKERE